MVPVELCQTNYVSSFSSPLGASPESLRAVPVITTEVLSKAPLDVGADRDGCLPHTGLVAAAPRLEASAGRRVTSTGPRGLAVPPRGAGSAR